MQKVQEDLFDNGFGGQTINPPFDGGAYTPFPPISGGGGGGYTPPVPPNPIFVPPVYTQNDTATLKISLSADEAVEFIENDISVGFGASQTITYSPSLSFGNTKTYKANLQNKIATNYFVVSVVKKFKPISADDLTIVNVNPNPGSSLFNYNSGLFNYNYNQTPGLIRNDQLYTEVIAIDEFVLQEDGNYSSTQTRTDSTSGIIPLQFKFKVQQLNPPTLPDVPPPTKSMVVDTLIGYELGFASNFQNELGDFITLNYQIVNNDNVIDSDILLLKNLNTDSKTIMKSVLENSYVNLSVEVINSVGKGTTAGLPEGYRFSKFYYANKNIAERYTTDFTKWNEVPKSFKIAGKELTSPIVVAAILEKDLQFAKPTISVLQTKFDVQVKDSDTEKSVTIPFGSADSDYVLAYLSTDKYIRVSANTGAITLYFQKDFNEVYGSKKVILIPTSEKYGTGDRLEVIVNFIAVNDFPSITQIIVPDSIDVPSFSDLQIEWDVIYNSFATSTIDVDLLAKDKSRIPLFKNLTPNGSFKINLRTLAEKFSNWNGNDNVTLVFKPFNRSGAEELLGNEYTITTNVSYPSISLDEDMIKKSIYDAFITNLSFIEPEPDSKYLTHLVNFGNDEQIIISSYEEDNWTLSDKKENSLGNLEVTKEVKSVILKLYSPLPANILTNSTFWITKLMSNPLIETVVLNDSENIECPTIKGPNFNIDVDLVSGQSTAYESLDNLFYSTETTSSSNLVSTYLSSSIINTDELNIEYVSGSTYLWNNFVHFSSAAERVDNFVYKLKLIEKYENAVSASLYFSGSAAEIISGSGSVTGSLSSIQERERQNLKKNQLINNFDGFEKFLYTSSSLSWPYVGTIRESSTSNLISNNSQTGWYDNIIVSAIDYDKNNPNYIQNNIPQYILNSPENDSLLLFFAMIGHHFDNIYYHTKAIENSRGLGYKSKNGITDKMLFDTLKSFGWDAKNLAVDKQLWEYAFGLDVDGNVKNATAAKQRTYDVWRRIINNLPYLLKNKGTRRGIYAIMACYGIPSSNLSILEFGGPEVTDTTKSKLVMDNITTALKMSNDSKIVIEWKDTNKGTKPNTIELFVKPSTNSNYTLISGSGWDVNLRSSTTSSFGNVVFNYSGSNAISSSLLPIFNGNFFGIAVSSGSNGLKLDVRQSDKERTIFQQSITASVTSSWNDGSIIYLGGNYSGSVDEFRLWSDVLDTARFYEHVSFPEMINGNHISSSTDDLYFRLDFEYPKNLYPSASFINVANNIFYSKIELNPSSSLQITRNILEETGSIHTNVITSTISAPLSASATGSWPDITTYPYQFEAIDRSVVLEIPDIGSGRYSTNKVRFESQELVSDLSSKHRSTKKAFDQSPTDSNRVGLFFSPTKELNMDIAKSFGGVNLDNYIGDPSDRYKSNYSKLDNLRNYYFERFDGRDIYAYINLIKLYEKSMFEDIKKMLPARVKATTGLLIEPHILERSKIAHKRPSGDEYQQEVTIVYSDNTTTFAENNQYDALITNTTLENVIGENNQYEAIIYSSSFDKVVAENIQYDSLITNSNLTLNSDYYQKEVIINAGLAEASVLSQFELDGTTNIIGQTDYENIGFGIYAQSGSAIRTYFDKDGRRIKERIRVQLVTEQKERIVPKYAVTASNGAGDPRGGYISDIETYTETKLNIQPFSGSTPPVVSGNIISIKPVSGYLPTHHRNTSDLTTGMMNSYYKGSKNTAATTLDGTPPIETFTTNPNTLRVNKAGRGADEPILEIE